jgi:sec-independent protein translocase protein TatA
MIPQLLTPTNLAILLVALLLIFGPRRLPQTGRALGRSLREFREAIAGQEATPDAGLAAPPTNAVHGENTDLS